MSRSRRKTQISGIAADSDKLFKVAEHRRERRATRCALKIAKPLKSPRLFGDPWHSDKDGKLYRADAGPEFFRK
jgi:hypothetical protein